MLEVDTRGCSQARLILWHFCELLSTCITTMGGNLPFAAAQIGQAVRNEVIVL